MRGQAGLTILWVVALVSLPRAAPAGCKAMGVRDVTCSAGHSSIDSCVNAIWTDLSTTAVLTQSLKSNPNDLAARMSQISQAKADLLPTIRLLGNASNYSFNHWAPSCDGPSSGTDCETALQSARAGLDLLTKPELVTALSPATRERLGKSLREHEAKYTAQLELIATSNQGDPGELCNDAYASPAACSLAIAADRAALHAQAFPVYFCGRVIPGRFVTPKKAPQDANHPEPQSVTSEMPFDQERDYYQMRLQEETERLAKLKQAR